jgi:hypothetical protein
VPDLPPRNFVAGELAPWVDGLPGVSESGAKTVENFIVRKTGAVVRRPGTFYAGEVKNSLSTTILVPFVTADDSRFILEIGNGYIRPWDQSTRARVGTTELASPWSTAELSEVRWAYWPAEKAIYWVHPKHPPKKLELVGPIEEPVAWNLTTVDLWTRPSAIMAQNVLNGKKTILIDGYGPDGVTEGGYTEVNSQVKYIHDVSHNGVVYIMLQDDANDDTHIYTSKTGMEWVPAVSSIGAAITVATNHGYKIAIGGHRKIIVVASSTAFYTSENDGTDWRASSHVDKKWDVVGYSRDNDTWRMLAQMDINNIFQAVSSDDGFTWVDAQIHGPNVGRPTGILAENNTWLAWTRGEPNAPPPVGDTAGMDAVYTASVGEPVTTSFALAYESSQPIADIAYGTPAGTPTWLMIHSPTAAEASSSILKSLDNGATWASAAVMIEPTLSSPDHISWTGHKFVITQSHARPDGTAAAVSDDGESWVVLPPGNTESPWGSAKVASQWFTSMGKAGDRQPTFNSTADYPSAITVHEQRLVMASTTNKSAHIWGSKTRHPANFYVGETAEESWEYELGGNANVDIQWILGGNSLVVGSRTAEGVMRGEQGMGITPLAASYLWQSTFGSKNLQPVRVHDHVIFAQRGGEVIRGLVPAQGNESWKSPDLTLLADHVAKGGITGIDHQDDPFTIIWFTRTDGQLLSCTFEGGKAAWARHRTYTHNTSVAEAQSSIESLAVVPTGSNEDEVWVVVERTIGGATKRYLEYFDVIDPASKEDAHYVDSGVEVSAGGSFSTINGLTHLAGEYVDVLFDGNLVELSASVTAGGQVNCSPGIAGTHAHVGLGYDSYLQTTRLPINKRKRVHGDLHVWEHDSIGGQYGPNQSTTEHVAITSTSELTTGVRRIAFPAATDDEGYIWIRQSDPVPLQVVAIGFAVELGDT